MSDESKKQARKLATKLVEKLVQNSASKEELVEDLDSAGAVIDVAVQGLEEELRSRESNP